MLLERIFSEKHRVVKFTALLCIAIATGGYLYYYNQKTHALREKSSQIETVAKIKIKQLSDWYKDELNDASLISKNEYLVEELETWHRTNKEIYKKVLLRRITSSKNEHSYQNIIIVSTEGGILLSADKDTPNPAPILIDAIKKAVRTDKTVSTDIYIDPVTNKIFIDFVSPVINSTAAVVFRHDPNNFLFPMLHFLYRQSESFELLLVKQIGDEVLYLNELRFKKDTALKMRVPITRKDLSSVQTVLGFTGIFEGKDYRDVDVIAYVSAVPDTPWFIVAKMDKSELFEDWHHEVFFLFIFVLLIILLVASVSGILYNRRQRNIYRELYQAQEEFKTTLYSIGDGVITTDSKSMIRHMNAVAESLTGWSEAEAQGRHIEEVFKIINESSRDKVENPVEMVLKKGLIVGLANHTLLISKDGKEIPIMDSGAPIRDEKGAIAGVVLVFRDQGEERENQKILEESEERFRLLYENSPVAYHSLDLDGNILNINHAWLEQLGYQHSEVIGHNIRDFLTKESVNLFQERFPKFVARGEVRGAEFDFVQKSGSIVHFSIDGRIGKDKDRHFKQTHCVLHNITERKKAEEALGESEMKFRELSNQFNTLLDAIPDNLILLDKDLKIIWVNNTVAINTGKTADRLIGQYCYSMLHGKDTPCGPCPVVETFKTKTPITMTVEAPNLKLWEVRTMPLLDNDGNVFQVIDVARDVTEQRRLEAQLRQSQKMESVGMLAGGIAHDFNNILTAIVGYASLTQMKLEENSPLRKNIDNILSSSERAASLIQNLLAFSRKQLVRLTPFDLNLIVRSFEKFILRLIREDISLKTIYTDEVLFVLADPTQIEQVMMNLVANARDAMPEGGTLAIETKLAQIDQGFVDAHGYGQCGSYACLTISDTGTGMDERTKSKVFEPFFTTKEVGKGTGLGLASAYGIIKQLDGFINVYSELGMGTTFKIYLPLIKPDRAGIQDAANESGYSPGGTETVLVAEDNETVREVTATILRDAGYKVIEAVDGNDAVIKFAENRGDISIVVLDAIMPNKNGKQALLEIRVLNPEIKSVLVSGYAEDVFIKDGKLDKETVFLQKPVKPSDLLKAVRDTLDS